MITGHGTEKVLLMKFENHAVEKARNITKQDTPPSFRHVHFPKLQTFLEMFHRNLQIRNISSLTTFRSRI